MWTLKELSHYYVFGEDFGEKAKARMEAAAALQKIVTPAGSKGKQTVFQKGHPQKNTWGRQGGSQLQVKEVSRLKVLSRKVLTRDIRCVNTSRVNFKYNYEPYPIVTTGVCSAATPRGVDKSVEPDYHQSHVGWKVSPVRIKLGENNSRPMGLASHKGIQTGTGTATLANKANASNTLFIGGRGNDLYRGQRIITSQRCSDRDPTCSGRLRVTNLSGRKEGGGTEAGNKSEGSQHVCEAQAFQNGGASHSPRSHPIRRLDDKIGSEGCISSGTNSY